MHLHINKNKVNLKKLLKQKEEVIVYIDLYQYDFLDENLGFSCVCLVSSNPEKKRHIILPAISHILGVTSVLVQP